MSVGLEEFGQAEIDAIEAASKRVENMLKRPDQLERVEQMRRKEARKKASVEARLKTAMQSQLDGVKTGLTQLQGALEGIKEIRQWVAEVDSMYEECSELTSKLGEVKEVANQHSQLGAAVESLKHIFTVPQNVAQTEKYIMDNNYLAAHKGLMELESSRDDLLYELHKNPSNNPTDDILLKKYFEKVETLSDKLFRQLKTILQQMLNAVQTQPALVVTCFRIIEREERLDKKMLDREKMAQFQAPARPKRWKEKAFAAMKDSVESRIEGSQLEDRTMERMWLVRHLELIRQNVLNDLIIVKYLCVPCFPPHYNVFKQYVGLYHEAIGRHLQEIMKEVMDEINQLERDPTMVDQSDNISQKQNEIISLLSWLSEYTGPMLMGSPDLGLNVKQFPPLLNTQEVDTLQQIYIKTLHQNIQKWMGKALNTDKKDWQRDMLPEADGEGYYHTQMPVIIFQMMEQNLEVSNQISKDLTSKVVLICVEELQIFIDTYREGILEYRKDHLIDRHKPRYFFQYMVAVANNFHTFMNFTQQLEKRHLQFPGSETTNMSLFRSLLDSFKLLAGEVLRELLQEMFMDLNPQFQDVFTRKWFEERASVQVDILCVTIEDYYHDFTHLRRDNFVSLLNELEKRTLRDYIKAVFDKKMTFKSYDERKKAGEKLCKEGDQMKVMFDRLTENPERDQSSYEAIPALAEVIKMEDTSLISLELSTLLCKFPDIRMEHLVNLLVLRGDMTTSVAKEVIQDSIPDGAKKTTKKTIFSQIPVK